MLEYGLPDPLPGHRWVLKPSSISKEYYYLHMEKQVKSFFGRTKYKSVHNDMVSNHIIKESGYATAVRRAAEDILHDINVNFNLPVGEVR